MKLICSQGDRRKTENPNLKVVSSKLTEDELHEIDLIANKKGISRSHWIRSLIVNSIEKQNSQEAA